MLGVCAPCYPICYLINKLVFSSSDEANDKSFFVVCLSGANTEDGVLFGIPNTYALNNKDIKNQGVPVIVMMTILVQF